MEGSREPLAWFVKFWGVMLLALATVLLSRESRLLLSTPLPLLEPLVSGLHYVHGTTKVMVLLSGWPDDHSVWASQVPVSFTCHARIAAVLYLCHAPF